MRDTIQDKLDLMKVETGLKLSLLVELVSIPVDRSGGYLTDFRSSKNVARATVKYSAKTHIDQMSTSHLAAGNIQYPEVLDDATHVVVGKCFRELFYCCLYRQLFDDEL